MKKTHINLAVCMPYMDKQCSDFYAKDLPIDSAFGVNVLLLNNGFSFYV